MFCRIADPVRVINICNSHRLGCIYVEIDIITGESLP